MKLNTQNPITHFQQKFKDKIPFLFSGSLSGHENRVTSICMAPSGIALVSCSWDQYVRVWG